MEIRQGQQTATMAQAIAHNLSTVDRDIEMLAEVLRARGDGPGIVKLGAVRIDVHNAYGRALAMFGSEIRAESHECASSDVDPRTGLVTLPSVGSERVTPSDAAMVRAAIGPDDVRDFHAALVAAHRAERYETR